MTNPDKISIDLLAFKAKLSQGIKVPGSKSDIQRIILISIVALKKKIYEEITIKNMNYCNDVSAALNLAESSGIIIKRKEDSVSLRADFTSKKYKLTVNCGESGLLFRMSVPILSLFYPDLTLKPEGSLKVRPQQNLAKNLNILNVRHNFQEGNILKITGKIEPGSYLLDGRETSQVISGILCALAFSDRSSRLVVENPVSSPYLKLTVSILEQFSCNINLEMAEKKITFLVDPYKKASNKHLKIIAEGDWSSAATLIASGLLLNNHQNILTGLNKNSKHADIKILNILKESKFTYTFQKKELMFSTSSFVMPANIDLADTPDLFPVIAALASMNGQKTNLKGIHRLIGKESNRLVSITDILSGFGIKYSLDFSTDTLQIRNNGNKKDSFDDEVFNTYNDHRIAMLIILLVLKYSPKDKIVLKVSNKKCLDKSYPSLLALLN